MSNLCRICAKDQGTAKGLCLFKKSLKSRTNLNWLQKITGLELKKKKYMPENMCSDCQFSLKQAFQFRKTCRRTQILLGAAVKGKNLPESERIQSDTDECWQDSSESCSDSNYFEDIEERNSLPLSPVVQMVEDTCDLILSHPVTIPDMVDDEKPIPIEVIDENIFDSNQEIPTLSSPIDEELKSDASLKYNLRTKEITKTIDDVEFQSDQPSSPSAQNEKPKTKRTHRNTGVKSGKSNSKKPRKLSALLKSETIDSKSDISPNDDSKNKKIDKYICELCGQSFDVRHYFESHVNRHYGEKPFKCNICPETYYTQQSLKRHLLKHAGALPNACRFCPRRFLDSSAKVRHERMHTNDRPYKCSYCEKAFTTNYVLKNHLLTHTGERSFSCNLCARSFVQKKHLLVHYKSTSHKQKEEEAKIAQN